MDSNILGKRLKTLRVESGLTQEEFGLPYSLRKSTVSQYESGSSRPDDELKKRIALDYNVSIDWLLGLTDIRNYEEITTEDKINKLIEESGINTIAAHFEGEEFTEDDLEDIENFINFVLAKKKKKK